MSLNEQQIQRIIELKKQGMILLRAVELTAKEFGDNPIYVWEVWNDNLNKNRGNK